MTKSVLGHPPVIDAAPSGRTAGSDRVRAARPAAELGQGSKSGQVRLASVDMVAAAAVIGSIDALIDHETIAPALDLSPTPSDTVETDLTEAELELLMSVTIDPAAQDDPPPRDLDIFALDLEQLMALEVFAPDMQPEDLTLISFEDLLDVDVQPAPAEPTPPPFDLTAIDLETLQDLQFGDHGNAADAQFRQFALLEPIGLADQGSANGAHPFERIAEFGHGSGSVYVGPQPTAPDPVLENRDDPLPAPPAAPPNDPPPNDPPPAPLPAPPPAPPNAPPSALGEFLSIPAGEALFGNVLANDTDPDGDPLIVVGAGTFSSAMAGHVELAADGEFTYWPADGYDGRDSFNYTISDDHGNTASAVADIKVLPPPEPIAVDDDATTDEDVAVIIDAAANDIDPVGDALVIEEVTQGANGTVDINSDGTLTYTANPDFNGTDRFTYTVYGADRAAATATVTVTVRPVNDGPTAVDDAVIATEGIGARGNLLRNDFDRDGDPLTVTTTGILTTVAGGQVQIAADGTFDYRAAPDITGTDSFAYTVSDGAGGTATATATVTINLNPVAVDDTLVIAADSSVTGTVLANDSDPDGDALGIADTGPFATAQGGTVRMSEDGTFDYKPLDGFRGTDSFTYTVEDGRGGRASAAMTISIVPSGSALQGTPGNDILIGTPGGDILNGNAGDDVLIGLAGADRLNGGAGVDTASYADSAARVEISLEGGTALGGDAEGDMLTGIENVIGSAFDDHIRGDTGNNAILGGTGDDELLGYVGDDLLIGGPGADILAGGDGFDRADYTASDAGVTIDLASGRGLGGHAEGDFLEKIERVSGSTFDDAIHGDRRDNAIDGGAGNDRLTGGGGTDLLDGGAGDDTLSGDAGIDILLGGAGDDILDGGLGFDALTGGAGNDRFIVAPGSGVDLDAIADFQIGRDIIDLSAFGMTDWTELAIDSDGLGGSIISLPTGDSIALLFVEPALLSPADVIL